MAAVPPRPRPLAGGGLLLTWGRTRGRLASPWTGDWPLRSPAPDSSSQAQAASSKVPGGCSENGGRGGGETSLSLLHCFRALLAPQGTYRPHFFSFVNYLMSVLV